MIKPTIGSVVLVNRGNSTQPEPALICYVHSDTMISVRWLKTALPSHGRAQLERWRDEKQKQVGF